jgi:hypothetical protein
MYAAVDADATVRVAALLVTLVAPVLLTITRYRSLLSDAFVRFVRASEDDVAPLTLAHVEPASSLFCH